MEHLLLSAMVLASTISIAQETVNISMGAGYTNEVYFKIADGTENSFEAANWDIAFLRNNPQNIGIRVNDGIGIQVFEAADNAAAFDAVDVANEANWIQLYNDDTNWENGAFMQGSATFGWGEYNPVTHIVDGTIVFVLKYADGTYKKFINEQYSGGYTFKYATWDGTEWVDETTHTIDNTSNPDNRYNYYSLQNNEEVVAEPAVSDWDFVFRKFTTFLNPPGQYYPVTGALHNPNVTVAQNEETGDANPNDLDYLEDISTIGSDWKSFNGSGFTIDENQKYYVKYDDNTVYRLNFTAFDGTATGNLTFVYEDVSNLLGFENVSKNTSFGMYPNPSESGEITIVFENATTTSETSNIEIFAMNGAKVLMQEVTNNAGFFNKTVDVSALQTGVYIVRFNAGDHQISKKLIIK